MGFKLISLGEQYNFMKNCRPVVVVLKTFVILGSDPTDTRNVMTEFSSH